MLAGHLNFGDIQQPPSREDIARVVTLLATRALQIQSVYRTLNWSVFFLLAATLPIGTALDKTGLADGKYLIQGRLMDMETREDLTEAAKTEVRRGILEAVDASKQITFAPEAPKYDLMVFTDIDCGFCRKFHTQIADINKAGIQVRYMMFPRSGPGTESWRKAESVWCSKDRKDALTRAKSGEDVKVKACDAKSVKTQYELGENLGIEGTPAIFTEEGEYIGGFLTPAQLLKSADESRKTASAAP